MLKQKRRATASAPWTQAQETVKVLFCIILEKKPVWDTVWGRAWGSAFLTNSQVMSMLLVHAPHQEWKDAERCIHLVPAPPLLFFFFFYFAIAFIYLKKKDSGVSLWKPEIVKALHLRSSVMLDSVGVHFTVSSLYRSRPHRVCGVSTVVVPSGWQDLGAPAGTLLPHRWEQYLPQGHSTAWQQRWANSCSQVLSAFSSAWRF